MFVGQEILLTVDSPEQIQALRSEADTIGSPELGPPPTSEFIDDEPVKVDSPSRPNPVKDLTPSPQRKPQPPVLLASPRVNEANLGSPSPQKKKTIEISLPTELEIRPMKKVSSAEVKSLKTGAKRKFGAGDETQNNARITKGSNENMAPRVIAGKSSIREKAEGKPVNESATMKKEKEGPTRPKSAVGRKPLAAKNANDDISSPRKLPKEMSKPGLQQSSSDPVKQRLGHKELKTKVRPRPFVLIESDSETESGPPPVVSVPLDLQPLTEVPTAENEVVPPTAVLPKSQSRLVETTILSPHSPERTPSVEPSRGDTPPPADISSNGEAVRPSRRVRAAVSYAEPNLRAKMRRPTKELFDAVTGEGRYARRSSAYENMQDGGAKRESMSSEVTKATTAAEPGSVPGSPLARKAETGKEMPSNHVSDRKRQLASFKTAKLASYLDNDDDAHNDSESAEPSSDLYDFPNETPPSEESGPTKGRRRTTSRQPKPSRRFSEAVDSDEEFIPKPTGAARRRTTMV